MKSKEMIDNDKLNVKVNSILQVKQIPNEPIQNNYHTNLTILGHEQTEQSQPIKIPETGTESTDKEDENQINKLEREENVTHITKTKFERKIWKKHQGATFQGSNKRGTGRRNKEYSNKGQAKRTWSCD